MGFERHEPPGASATARAWRGALRVATALLLCGCAGDLEPDTAPGRQGRTDAVGLPVDLGLPDQGRDQGHLPDGGPQLPPAHRIWWVIYTEQPWAAGVRAALEPPHPPSQAPGALPAPADGFLVEWRGPESPGEARLAAIKAAGHPAAALYALADRAEDVRADLGWLSSRHLDSLRVGDAPTVAVRWAGAPRSAQTAWLDGLRALPEPLAWIAVIDDEPVPEGAVAVLPAGAYGHGPAGATAAGEAAARLARQREAARAAAAAWLPRARPGTNLRLDQAGALVDAPGLPPLARSLVLARRAARGVVVVDGWGGWRDDRQLDPVSGALTQQPAALTSGRAYAGYGPGRLAQVASLLGTVAGAPPSDLARAPSLLPLFEAPGVRAEAEFDDRGVAVAVLDEGGADGRRAEWALDLRPFVVPADAALTYRRSGPQLAVDLVFADGQRLLTLAPPGDPLTVRISLAALAGRRVAEVALVAFAGGPRWQARIDDLRLTP